MVIPDCWKKSGLAVRFLNHGRFRRCLLPVLLGVLLLHGVGISESSDGRDSGEPQTAVYSCTRPATSWLHQEISRSSSLVSEKFRNTAAAYIAGMDAAHLNCLGELSLPVNETQKPAQWVALKMADWPALMPACERTFLAALKLQVDMLDVVLKIRDPQRASQLSDGRRMIRVRDKRDAFFGDARDQFIGSTLQILQQISDLQNALGSPGDNAWDFPGKGQTVSDGENALLSKMEFVYRKSQYVDCQ